MLTVCSRRSLTFEVGIRTQWGAVLLPLNSRTGPLGLILRPEFRNVLRRQRRPKLLSQLNAENDAERVDVQTQGSDLHGLRQRCAPSAAASEVLAVMAVAFVASILWDDRAIIPLTR